MPNTARRGKDNQWIRFRGVKALKASHPDVRRLKRERDDPSLHGNKVWRSSFALIDYLHRHPIPRGARVVDVGCGWGLTGIWLAKTFADTSPAASTAKTTGKPSEARSNSLRSIGR